MLRAEQRGDSRGICFSAVSYSTGPPKSPLVPWPALACTPSVFVQTLPYLYACLPLSHLPCLPFERCAGPPPSAVPMMLERWISHRLSSPRQQCHATAIAIRRLTSTTPYRDSSASCILIRVSLTAPMRNTDASSNGRYVTLSNEYEGTCRLWWNTSRMVSSSCQLR